MSTITLKGNTVHTSGTLPAKGAVACAFTLTKADLSDLSLTDYSGHKKVLNVFPSIDTGTCAASVRRFNKEAAALKGVKVLNVSADLPFALARFCGAEGIQNADTASTFRSTFARDYGLEIADGPLRGLCSRAVIVVDQDDRVLYSEQVAEIANEPNYEAALSALR